MIFVTVGTQLPFPRLVDLMDELAQEHGLEVFAQTADPNASYEHIQHAAFLSPDEYDDIIHRTKIIVGHAGIGTVLTAKKVNKPVVIFPRKASLGEHRNEHQLATAQHLTGHEGVYVAPSKDELEGFLVGSKLEPAAFAETVEKARLLRFVRSYVYSVDRVLSAS